MTTRNVDLTSARWIELGETPCLLQNIGREAASYVIGTALPSAMGADAHVLNPTGSTSVVSISLTGQKVYARSMWSDATKVAFSPAVPPDRLTAIVTFVATALAPLPAGKLVQTVTVDGVRAGDTLIATARTALPAGITLAGEVTALAGKATLAFIVAQPLSALVATPVAIELTRVG